MAKTAMQQMIEKIERYAYMVNEPNPINYPAFLAGIAFDLKKIEREQIEEAYVAGMEFGCKHDDPDNSSDYYNQTYGEI